MKPVIWLDRAVQDLMVVGQYIAQRNKQAAYNTLLRIKAAGDSLSLNPNLGREGRIQDTRELVITGLPYILPYRVTGDNIQILAVMHTSRKWPEGI